MSPLQVVSRMESSLSSILKSLKSTLCRRRILSSRTKFSRREKSKLMTGSKSKKHEPVLSEKVQEFKPQTSIGLHLQRTHTTLTPEDQQKLLSAFEELTQAYGYLDVQLQRVTTRIGHLRRSLKALRDRQASVHCRLGINKSIDQFASELVVRRREEHALLCTLDRLAKELGDLGRF